MRFVIKLILFAILISMFFHLTQFQWIVAVCAFGLFFL